MACWSHGPKAPEPVTGKVDPQQLREQALPRLDQFKFQSFLPRQLFLDPNHFLMIRLSGAAQALRLVVRAQE